MVLLAVRISSYGCTWEVWRALKKQELLSATPRATLTLLSCSSNFPRASITRYTHAKHEPIPIHSFLLKDPQPLQQHSFLATNPLICYLKTNFMLTTFARYLFNVTNDLLTSNHHVIDFYDIPFAVIVVNTYFCISCGCILQIQGKETT